jgi:hypothetical protein
MSVSRPSITDEPLHILRASKVLLVCTALLTVSACNKDKASPTSPDDVTGPADVADLPDVPQEPDPPQIQAGAHEYLMGNFQQAIDMLTPVYEDLKARNQYRASALAGGWLALAHARLVYENGRDPTQHALAMAGKLEDPEVVAIAKLAEGAMLLGNDDYDAAAKVFDEAARAAPQTTAGALANILRAETRIGSAFGNAESNELQNPRELETARAAYEAAAKTAEAGIETSLILGRVEEGLAAVSKYKNDKAGVCKHAHAAIGHYRAGGASEFLIEGPTQLAFSERCDPPAGS